MPQLQALIFDLDGTLMDSAGDLRGAVNGVLQARGRRPVSLEEIKGFVGDGLPTLLTRAFAATGERLSPQDNALLLSDFLRLYQDQKASPDQLYPRAADTLRHYRGLGLKLGLCTNKMHGPTLRLLGETGLANLFDAVAGGDSYAVCKPHPGHVLGVAAALRVKPEHCVMIGDSVNDIRAAHGAGMAAIAVSHGYGEVTGLGADAVIDGFAGLSDALDRLGYTAD